MKVGVPTMGDSGIEEDVSTHFGRAPTFTIVETESEDIEIITNIKKTGGGRQPPEQLSEKGLQVMLCSDLGPKAIEMSEQSGIEVYVGASGTVEETLDDWEAGELSEATDEDACQQHRR